jgi:hypothetical protein
MVSDRDPSRLWGRRAACLALAGVLFASPARGDDIYEDAKRAEVLFNEGRIAMDRNDYATACPKFEASLKLVRRAGTLFNMAQCEEHEGRLVAAQRYWKEGIVILEPGDKRLAPSKKRLAELSPRIPYLTIKPAADLPKDARVTIDGKEAEALGVELPVDPGEHTVAVTGPRRAEQRVKVKLGEKEKKEVSVSAGALIVEPPRGPAGLGRMQIAGLAALGVGAVGFVAAGVTGGLVLSTRSQVDGLCPDGRCLNMTDYGVVERGRGLLVANAVAWGVGIAGAGAGTALLLIGSRKGTSKGAREASFFVGPQGLCVRGSF